MLLRGREDNAWVIHSSDIAPQVVTEYSSNAEESDNRIWRHATQSRAKIILIYSPDTDIYNIGLTLICESDKQYIVQLNVTHSAEKRYLNLNIHLIALSNDPDLAYVLRNYLGITLQTVFICTGCDYISYFKSVGKLTILNNFFHYAEFICGSGKPGSCIKHWNRIKIVGFLHLLG